MSIEIKLVFASAHLAAKALAAIAASDNGVAAETPTPNVISPLDNPAAGVEVTPPVPPAAVQNAQVAAMFAGAEVTAPLGVPSAPSAAIAPPAAPGPVSAPITPPAPPAVDASGLPWDGRIHASTKSMKADGTWTARRGVDELTKNRVEAELRAAVSGAPAAPAAAAMPAGSAVPPAPPAGSAVPPAPVDFGTLMAKMAPVFTQNAAEAFRITAELLAPHGLNVIGQLAARPDLVPKFDQQFFEAWNALPKAA